MATISDDAVLFDVPGDTPPEMRAVAELASVVDTLRAAVADLAEQHVALRRRVDGADRDTDSGTPASVRWDQLDRDAAMSLWNMLINWVGWLVERYQLTEELGWCWPQHPPLVEELTALCLSWHAAYETSAGGDAPLRWQESLERARRRWRDFDEQTKCRHGQHRNPTGEGAWPEHWRVRALGSAEADVAGRPGTTDSDSDGGERP